MALVLTVVAALVLVLLSLLGFWRDVRRGALALVGTLLGATLVGFWAEPWGQNLAKRVVGGDVRTLTFVVSCLLFLLTVLFVGYGGGVLLGRPPARSSFPQRLVGALLGLLNGALIVGYILRFAANKNPAFTETVQTTPLARVFHDGLPLLFLGVLVAVAVIVAVRGLLLATGVGRPAAVKPAVDVKPQPSSPGAAAKPATPQDRQRDVMGKIERHF